jgi:hypothetical protein
MGADFVSGMGFTHIHEEELHIIRGEFLRQVIYTADGAGGHRASGRTEGEHNVLTAAKIFEADLVACERASFEVRRAVARPGAARDGSRRCHVFDQQVLGKDVIVIRLQTKHKRSPCREVQPLRCRRHAVPFTAAANFCALCTNFEQRGAVLSLRLCRLPQIFEKCLLHA